jgi:CBS domain-containing protein
MKTVSDLLRAKPARLVTIRPEASVLDAIKVLAQEDIGAAIVMEGDHLPGSFPSATTRARSSSRDAPRTRRAWRRS